MEQRHFGDSDLVCSALGFGTWELGTTQYGEIDVEEASRAIRAALDCGITLFDTAEVYGPYHSEEILGEALGARRKEVVLVTKVGFEIDDLWEGAVVFRYDCPEDVLEHLLKSGAGTAFYDAIDPDRREPLRNEFFRLLAERNHGAGTYEVAHDFVACVARKP